MSSQDDLREQINHQLDALTETTKRLVHTRTLEGLKVEARIADEINALRYGVGTTRGASAPAPTTAAIEERG
jgi:uncharacterized protein YicC (UPF0701 family)